MISVVGGVYGEQCRTPSWDIVLGSAGRAAACLSTVIETELFSLVSEANKNQFQSVLDAYNIKTNLFEQDFDIFFQYLHPLAPPTIFINGKRPLPGDMPEIGRDNILYFGMFEYAPKVKGRRVVYDPQNGRNSISFSSTGSEAEALVYILNKTELEAISGTKNIDDAIEILKKETNVEAIILKNGPLGATVFHKDGSQLESSAYRTRSVFKIGSGDVFSAAFTYFWVGKGYIINTAADLASRSVAHYVESRSLMLLDEFSLKNYDNRVAPTKTGRIYLAAPFFSIEQIWAVEETKSHLENLGCTVFSPMHEVGIGGEPQILASADLEGLNECSALLALLNGNDPGTIFEIGYAVKNSVRVCILSERSAPTDLTMMRGTNCKIFSDYTTAIYSAVWESDA